MEEGNNENISNCSTSVQVMVMANGKVGLAFNHVVGLANGNVTY
jgi:hypothetical protein